MATVRVTIENKIESGKRKGWSRWVTRVDQGKRNGYAFDGSFLDDGEHDLPEGAIVIQKNPEGSVKNEWFSGVVFRVTANGLERIHAETFDWFKHFPSFRDFVAKAVSDSPCGAPSVDSSSKPEPAKVPAGSVIRVTVQDGKVQAVSGIPDGCRVDVFDYDTDDLPNGTTMSKDEDGDDCVRTSYASKGCAGRN